MLLIYLWLQMTTVICLAIGRAIALADYADEYEEDDEWDQ